MQKFIKYDINIKSEIDNHNMAQIVVEPLERGFGTTLGNALRRVLLSNIQGAAMFAIKIPGVTHEYRAIDGIHEDVSKIILNLKNLVIKIDNELYPYDEFTNMAIEKWPTMQINHKGAGIITGHDISCPNGFEIVNPDIQIATVTDEKVNFEMEIYAKTGRGYKTFIENKDLVSSIISLIPTDSDFSPVIKVAYDVEEFKESKTSLSDRLNLTVITNGSISGCDAISLAAHILTSHLDSFAMLNEQVKEMEMMKIKSLESAKIINAIPIEELDLPVRAFNGLKQEQIFTTAELLEKDIAGIQSIRNLGRKSVDDIIKALHDKGLKLKGEE